MVSSLSVFTIPYTTVQLVMVRDTRIPKGVSAFFMRRNETSIARIRVKDKKKVLKFSTQKDSIVAILDRIAEKYDYSFDRLLEAGKKKTVVY